MISKTILRTSFDVCFDSTPELSDVDELMMERNSDDDKRAENKSKIKSKKTKTKKSHKHKKKDEKTPKYVNCSKSHYLYIVSVLSKVFYSNLLSKF